MNSLPDASVQVPNHVLLTDLMAPIKPAVQPPKEKKREIAIIPPNYAMNQINIAPEGSKPLFVIIDATIAEEVAFRTVYKRNDFVKSSKTLDVAMINRDNMYIRCFPYCDRMNHKYQNYNTACGRAIKLSVEFHIKKNVDGTVNDYDVHNNLIITSFICTTKNELTKLPVGPVTKKELRHLAKVNKDLVIAKLLRVDTPVITEWGKKYVLFYEINPLGSLWSCTEILDDCMHHLTCSFLFKCNPPPSVAPSIPAPSIPGPSVPVEGVSTESASEPAPVDSEPEEYFSVYVDIQSKPFQITSSIKEAIIKQQLKAVGVGHAQLSSFHRKQLHSLKDDALNNDGESAGKNSTHNTSELPFRHELFSFHALNDATASSSLGGGDSSMSNSSNANLLNLINKKYGAPGLLDGGGKSYDSSDTESESGSSSKRQKGETLSPKYIQRDLDNVKEMLEKVHIILNVPGAERVPNALDDMLVALPGKGEHVIGSSSSSDLDQTDKFAGVLSQFKPTYRRITSTLSDSIGDQSLEELAMNNFFLKFKGAYCDTIPEGLPTMSLFSLIAESMSNDSCQE
jgi:hypothetical protein